MLEKTTSTYANHDIPLECDIYDGQDYPTSTPVFLFFHSGGLVAGARVCIPPWLAQVCYQRKWPLISPSYRLLPQAGGKGLLEDASAAYAFAQSWKLDGVDAKRRIIVGGASAGFFIANLIAHHVVPPPTAMLCITGIPTFHHSFFNSSTLLTPRPIKDEEMADFIKSPVQVGSTPEYDTTAFAISRLLPSGAKNPDYVMPARPVVSVAPVDSSGWDRGCLYDYYLYKNAFLDLVGDVDPGFGWAKDNSNGQKLKAWPVTIFIQGDEDYDTAKEVTIHVVDCLGPKKSRLHLAKGQGHLFEATSYLEDEGEAMDTVRNAIAFLDAQL